MKKMTFVKEIVVCIVMVICNAVDSAIEELLKHKSRTEVKKPVKTKKQQVNQMSEQELEEILSNFSTREKKLFSSIKKQREIINNQCQLIKFILYTAVVLATITVIGCYYIAAIMDQAVNRPMYTVNSWNNELPVVPSTPEPDEEIDEEFNLFCRLVFGEARGEIEASQIAHGNVIKNRYNKVEDFDSNKYANRMEAVALAWMQFECVQVFYGGETEPRSCQDEDGNILEEPEEKITGYRILYENGEVTDDVIPQDFKNLMKQVWLGEIENPIGDLDCFIGFTCYNDNEGNPYEDGKKFAKDKKIREYKILGTTIFLSSENWPFV